MGDLLWKPFEVRRNVWAESSAEEGVTEGIDEPSQLNRTQAHRALPGPSGEPRGRRVSKSQKAKERMASRALVYCIRGTMAVFTTTAPAEIEFGASEPNAPMQMLVANKCTANQV